MDRFNQRRPADFAGALGGLLAGGLLRTLRRRLVPILILVGLVVLLLWLTSGGTLPDDGEPIPVSADDALALATKVVDAVGDAPGTKEVVLSVSDREVTSFLAIAAVLRSGLEDAGGTGSLEQLPELEGQLPDLQGRLEDLANARGDTSSDDALSVEKWRELIESEDGLGSVFSRGLDLRVTIKEPEVRFNADGSIIVRGYGRWALLNVPARLVVRPQIVENQVQFEVVEGQFGRLPLPTFLSNVASNIIERALLAGHEIASVDVIDVSEGTMRFSGRINR